MGVREFDKSGEQHIVVHLGHDIQRKFILDLSAQYMLWKAIIFIFLISLYFYQFRTTVLDYSPKKTQV